MVGLSFLSWLLLSCLLVHCLIRLKSAKANMRKLPPGPFPLPIFGNIFQLEDKPHRSMAELAKIYGPIITLQLGQLTTIVISSAAMAKEVIQKNDLSFCTRHVVDSASALNHHEFSMVWLPISAPWRNLRKVSNSHLFSSTRLDASRHLRQKKVGELLAYLQSICDTGVAVEIGKVAFETSLNLLSSTLFSEDLVEFGSDSSSEYKEVVWGVMVEFGRPNIADFFPILRKLDPQGSRHRMTIYFEKLLNLFNNIIDKRLQAKESGSVKVNDVLDSLLQNKLENGQVIERSYISHLLLDIFIAGTDTTSSTIEWAMAELLRHPDKLKKAQVELEQFIGKENIVEEGDIAKLPYLQAIMKETFRLHPPGPLFIPRKVDTDVELCGFTVPKNAQVRINAWAIGRDANFWENPDSFEPERFLGCNIDVKGQDFELIPFGSGRRICPGLPLANRMVHLMLGSLIHSFNWRLEDGNEPESMDMDEKFGLTLLKAVPLRAIPLST